MELTKDILLERRTKLLADLNAIDGAIQQIDWTLEFFEEDGEETPLLPDSIEEEANGE